VPDSIVIVGAGPGLGSAMAKRFANGGWNVALLANRQEVLDDGAAELEPLGVKLCPVLADVTDGDAVQRACAVVHDKLGVPSVVVYNASIFQPEPALELSIDALRLALNLHVVGAFHTAKSAVDLMRPAGRGVLVFTVNTLATHPEAASTALSIGKGAQLNLALSLDLELADTGLHVAIVTITQPIKAGTAFDPANIAEVYWRIAQQAPDAFQRDHVFDGTS
jgi:NAD(P)-dependent dehydrogenase (short-subunit alcohol dehydrogenase family)